ncbi:MAG: ATP-binding cassette domain-containing protein, partial [Aggregatilineales bacterium]
MSILSATALSKAFGAEEVFSGVSLEIPHAAKIALVGPNGAGKTTLLRILVGLDEPNGGTVNRMRGLRIGFLPQRPELLSQRTLWEELLSAFDDLRRREAQLLELAHQLGERPDDAELLERYGAAQHAFEAAGGYAYETRLKQVLQGLGFTAEDSHKPLPILSGGQKTRAFLANAAKQRGGEAGAAMTRLLADPQDAAADALLSRDPDLYTMLRTTCVATLLDGGHANNALPQRAGANINCRVIPGESYDSTEQALVQAIGDPKIKLTRVPPDRPVAPPVTLTKAVVGPAQALASRYFPGVPFTPTMLPGGT